MSEKFLVIIGEVLSAHKEGTGLEFHLLTGRWIGEMFLLPEK